MRKPRYGDELVVDVQDIDSRGRPVGVAEHESGRYHAIARVALPGERVLVQVLRRRGSKVEVRELETLRSSEERVEPRCAHFGTCGGCRFQHLDYAAQLRFKHAHVARLFAGAQVEPVVACDDPWRYRNKMDFTFGARRWIAPGEPEGVDTSFALGLHPREQHLKVLSIDGCSIQFEAGDAIVRDARRLALEQGLEPWDVRAHRGLLRHLVLRESRATREVLVQLTTSSESRELVEPYVRALLAAQPRITTFVQAVSTRLAAVAGGDHEIVWSGSGAIRERLAGLWFEISAGAFFQTNTAQAERLVELAIAELAPRGVERVLDVYCGAGAFSLPLARRVREVQGVELSDTAVRDARRNAELNGVANANFEAADAADWLRGARLDEFDLALVDPPRAGVHPKALEALAAMRARRLVYVSCNPASAAHDVAQLDVAGWRLLGVRPVDLFPHTPHVECVLTLERAP